MKSTRVGKISIGSPPNLTFMFSVKIMAKCSIRVRVKDVRVVFRVRFLLLIHWRETGGHLSKFHFVEV